MRNHYPSSGKKYYNPEFQNVMSAMGINGQVYSHSNRKSQIKFENGGTDVTHITNNFCPVLQTGHSKHMSKHLNLTFFKLKPCPQNNSHNHKNCPYYHNDKDRKRPNSFYSAELCDFIENNQNCPYEDSCTKSHNRVEQLVIFSQDFAFLDRIFDFQTLFSKIMQMISLSS